MQIQTFLVATIPKKSRKILDGLTCGINIVPFLWLLSICCCLQRHVTPRKAKESNHNKLHLEVFHNQISVSSESKMKNVCIAETRGVVAVNLNPPSGYIWNVAAALFTLQTICQRNNYLITTVSNYSFSLQNLGSPGCYFCYGWISLQLKDSIIFR